MSNYTAKNSIDYIIGDWVKISIIADFAAKKSYIYVDGVSIGSVSLVDHNNAKYKDAFSLRFCDGDYYTAYFDNFEISGIRSIL